MAGALPPAIELRAINKHFGPVHANKDISMTVPKGTIHGVNTVGDERLVLVFTKGPGNPNPRKKRDA